MQCRYCFENLVKWKERRLKAHIPCIDQARAKRLAENKLRERSTIALRQNLFELNGSLMESVLDE